MKKFKAGDKIYCPKLSTKVLVLRGNTYLAGLYTLRVAGTTFTIDGRHHSGDELPIIFPATEENHALLEKLYGVEFEKPPVKPTSEGIIQAMLERGDKYVPCWVHDLEGEEQFVLITERETTGWYIDGVGNAWATAQPIDPITGELLMELPE